MRYAPNLARSMVAVALLSVSACHHGATGMLLSLDEGWKGEVLLTSGDGILSPDGLLWHDGRLFIADEGGAAVRVWKPGAKVQTLADKSQGLFSPEDLAIDSDGAVYCSDDTAGGVRKIESGNVTIHLHPRFARSTEGLTMAPDGTLLVGDNDHQLLKVRSPDRFNVRARLRKPESLAFDEAGNLFIADNHDDTLYLLANDGQLKRLVHGLAGFSPESIRYAGDGVLYITDSHHGKLFRFSQRDGLFPVALFGGTLANVQGITTDDHGSIYLSFQTDLHRGKGYVLRLTRTASPQSNPVTASR